MESSHSSRRSHSQSKSKSSSSYRTRSFASSSSSYSKKIDLAAEAAALKSKLKFIDVLSQKQIELNQKQSELNRLETIRDIEIAEAKLDAIAKIQHEDDRSSRAIDSALSADKTEYVQDYVNTLHNSEPEPVKLNNSSNLPVTPSATTATNCDNRPTNFASTPVCEAQHDFVRATSSDIELTNRASALDRDTDKNNCSPVTCVEDNNFAFARVYDTGVNNSAFASSCSVELSHSVSQPLYTPSTPQINPYALRSQETCSTVYSSQQPNPVMSTKPAYYIPTRSTNEDDPLVRVAQVFAEHASFSRLPPPEPGTFSGDPLKYPSWKSAFQTLIDQKDIPVSERMYYLKRYLSGSARECVENYFLLSTEDAYDEAKKLLDDRFGNSFVIANAFRDKLDAWPKIHYRDGIGLRKFSDFLRQCEVAMRTTRSLCVLNDDRENKKLLKKLPDYLVSRWARIVHDWRIERMTFPPFVEFAKFIDKESNIACDPVTSLQQPGKELNQPDSLRYNNKSSWSSDKSHFRRPPGNVGSFATNSSENYIPSRSKVYENAPRQPVCFFCKDPHILDRCSVFLKKRIDDRKDFLRNNKLCFSCLNPGHYYKFCRRRKTCDICNMYHPTALHGDVHERTDTSERPATTSHNCKLDISDKSSHCSMILPVWISHMSNPELECLVYALLDTQSDSSFISDTTCDRLGIDGPHIQLSLSTMFAKDMRVDSRKMTGLIIRGHNCDIRIPLSTAYTRNEIPANRSHIPTPEIARRWPHLETIANELMSLNSCEIGLLIGYNCSRALLPREVIPPVLNEPFGQKTDLGWGIIGNVDPDINNELKCDEFMFCSHKTESNVQPLHSIREVSDQNIRTRHAFISFKTQVKEIVSPFNILKILETDFSDLHSCSNQTYSREDKQFLNKMSESIHLTSDNHYEMPLPFRDREPTLPNNRAHALQRLLPLRNKFKKDENYRRDYRQFMSDIISKGYAEKVPADELHQDIGRVWYIPHHAVYHPKKPNKIRVVFDCNARFKEQSINDHLLKGPDLTNTLTGVLCRFRKESIAVICDIEQMFYQFRVNTEHRNYLRFLWWINDEEEPTDFRMTVHLFGAGSSPGCANFGLKQAAIDNEEEFGSEVTDFLKRDFYVDDGLKSLPTEREAMNLIDGSRNLLAKCGLRLHKFVSNSKTVVNSIDPEDRAKEIRDLDLFNDELPMERVLGIQWCIESDCFQFHITLNDKPLTRRGILSTVCSIYDPLGFIAPFLLLGKQILQELCRSRIDWDTSIPEDMRSRWERWRDNLVHLSSVKIQRCFKPQTFGQVTTRELHYFSDASTYGYGQCTYLRLVDDQQNVYCSLVAGKSRVTPLKPITIPRLELAAALVSVRVGVHLKSELDYDDISEIYWTDSKVVLGYISNDARRFQTFVANRVQQIREASSPAQWNFVCSSDNPADAASRGLEVDELVNQSKWFTGPDFLWNLELPVNCDFKEESLISKDDPEVRKVQVFATQLTKPTVKFDLSRFKHISTWFRVKRAVALCLRLRKKIQVNQASLKSVYTPLTVDELQHAETIIIKLLQSQVFSEEIQILKKLQKATDDNAAKRKLKKSSSLYKLDPYLDHNGIIRVGGRLKLSNLDPAEKNPIILPKKHHLTTLIVRHFHETVKHQGKGLTTNEIRSSGFWILGCSSVVSSYIYHCVICRKLRGRVQEQKMSELPEDRLEPAPPFTYCAVDCFGPWTIKEGRSERKRYGVLYTCMTSRAVHIEIANSLSTDSFINSLRRFIAIRGPVRQLRSDNGTNFVGAKRELSELIHKINHDHVRQYLLENGCDFVFKMNIPAASHMGGVWERQIRSVRAVLSTLMMQSGTQLDDESLRTFMYEAAAIVNSRPLTVDTLNDVTSLAPLTPNHLLTMKTKIILPPPGEFQKEDVYSKKRWRRVQYMANEFWTRWKREFLQNQQVRSKWNDSKREICNGDIVLLIDDSLPRNQWSVCRVVETYPDADNHVRKVKLYIGNKYLNSDGKCVIPPVYLERPVQKLVLLLGLEDQGNPRQGAN